MSARGGRVTTRFGVAVLATLLLAALPGVAAADGWLETHRKMKRGCRMGGRGPRVLACYAAGEAAMARNAPPEELILEACGELDVGKARLLCVEEIMDHIGPTALDTLWVTCHREHDSVRDIRACLLARLFPEQAP